MKNLPEPSPQEIALSNKLSQIIKKLIANNGGKISFAKFMSLCLYTPSLGYYQYPKHKLGEQGDFTTAPLMCSGFSKTLANHCQKLLKTTSSNILEIGAGTGVMAKDILNTLADNKTQVEKYFILETSPDLIEQQQTTIVGTNEKYRNILTHINDSKDFTFSGVIIANELLDALACERFKIINGRINLCYVESKDDNFIEKYYPAPKEVINEINKLPKNIRDNFIEGYESEINLTLNSYLNFLYQTLSMGYIIFIDYGFLAEEYYHEDRNSGTLMCHYKHFAHTNPYIYPGLQDITSHINFTALGDYAQNLGFSVEYYGTQADYLIKEGILDLPFPNDEKEAIAYKSGLQKLLMPHEMGELFKVMILRKS